MAEEFFDLLDEEGNKTGMTKARSAVHRDGDWHAAINVLIVNERNEILQQKRAADKDSYPNMWDLSCGGHVLAGEDALTAARRELKEELGMNVAAEDLVHIGTFKTSAHPTPDFINNTFEHVYLVHTDKTLSDFVIQTEELSELRYIPWRKLRQMLAKPRLEDMLRHRKQYNTLFEILEREGA